MMAARKNKVLLSIGHGYSARELSRRLQTESSWRCIGTTRTINGCERVGASGASCRIWPGHSLIEDIAYATHILVSVPPNDDEASLSDPTIRLLGDQLVQVAKNLTWVGYLSTTAVYGDKSGEWVDEATETAPTTRRGILRVNAENQWEKLWLRSGLPIHIFRLAGIYGPERGPLAQIQTGQKKVQIVKSGQVFNRIHVEDIAQILWASMNRPSPGSIYNVCDDHPAPPEEVADFACQLLKRPPLPKVPFEDADLSLMAKSFFSETKRISNRSTKKRLQVSLRYPNYQTGLRSLI